ncbi:hypothetical protein LJE71_14065 [Xanthobacter autotrophicus]|uniref:hypothetical protein n=1 Tax=Xanthobacter autotrophicus TaxID=280 RepID=UPI001E552618|nr:hypothetical protein [Xanthobacter autotrophicus]UDQ87433.1 hypothetical protein LJE71_14065 [Xanthobacter autotrophicus]
MAAKAKTGFSGLDKSKTLAENTVNAGPVVLDSNVTFTAASPDILSRGFFLVDVANYNEHDHFYLKDGGGIKVINGADFGSVYYNDVLVGAVTSGGPYISVTLEPGITEEAMTAMARAVTYYYDGDTPSAVGRVVTYRILNMSGAETSATMLLKLKPENDLPVFSGLDTQSVHSASQAAPGVVIDADVHVANPDLTGFKGGKLAVHLAGATATDQLYLSDGHFSIIGKKLYFDGKQVGTVSADGHNGHDLAFTFSAAISDAQASQLAEQVSYRSTAASALSGARDVTFTVTDAEKSSTSAHTTLVFEADAPTLLSASSIVSDPFATLKAAVSGAPDDLSAVFATLEARAAGLLEAASHAHGALGTDHLPDLHLPTAVVDYLDAIGSSLLDHAQSAHPALVHELSDRAQALAAHVHEVLHPVHGSADALI